MEAGGVHPKVFHSFQSAAFSSVTHRQGPPLSRAAAASRNREVSTLTRCVSPTRGRRRVSVNAFFVDSVGST